MTLNGPRIILTEELKRTIKVAKGNKTNKQSAEKTGIPYGTFMDILYARYSISPENYEKILRSLFAESILELAIEQIEREHPEELRYEVQEHNGRVPYSKVKSLLGYLRSLGFEKKKLLGGKSPYLFETLQRKTISKERYNIIISLFKEKYENSYEQHREERKRLSDILFTRELKSEIGQIITEDHEFIKIDATAEALGMSKLAFDLLVAENREFFKKTLKKPNFGEDNHSHYTPNLLIKIFNENLDFNPIKYQYELLARYINAT